MNIINEWFNYWLAGNKPMFVTFSDSLTAVLFVILFRIPHELIIWENVSIFICFIIILQIIRIVKFVKHIRRKF